MAIPQRPFFPQSNTGQTRSQSGLPVLAVGRRVLVNCPGDGERRITVTDPTGTTAVGLLADGVEVEIVAWQPRGAGGTRYRIRSANGDVQGWLGAANLRPCPPPEPPRRAVSPVPASVPAAVASSAARAAKKPKARRR